MGGPVNGSSKTKITDSLFGSSYNFLVYGCHLSLTSLLFQSNNPFSSLIMPVLRELRCFPESSLILLCASAGFTGSLPLISFNFTTKNFVYSSLHFFLTCLSIKGYSFVPFALLRLSNNSSIFSVIHVFCSFLFWFIGIYSLKALVIMPMKVLNKERGSSIVRIFHCPVQRSFGISQ